jgi:hypothetical protein
VKKICLILKGEKSKKNKFPIYSFYVAFSYIIIISSGIELFAQTDFTYVTNQPVLGHGAAGEFDDGAVWFPAVIKDNDTLRMWYTGFDRSAWGGNPIGNIGYAWSLDGIEWNRDSENPVLSGELSWEAGTVMTCAVIKDGEILKMWYGANNYAPGTIGYATSIDGKIWNKHPVPVLEVGISDWDSAVMAPHTVIKEDSLYKMWYWGGDGWSGTVIIQVGFATSTDGIHWVKYDDPSTIAPPFANSDPVLIPGVPGEWDDGKLLSPMVMPTETGYEMWYNSTSKASGDPYYIGYATSPDGILWAKSEENPIFSNFPVWGQWHGGGTVLKYDKEYHLWFSLFHTTSQASPKIGYAISPIITTGIDLPLNESANPDQYNLHQNYPNPVNPTTAVVYNIPRDGLVRLQVYNSLGEVVATLVNQEKSVGTYSVEFDATIADRNLSSGIYFYNLKAGDFYETKKMVLFTLSRCDAWRKIKAFYHV